MENKKRRLKKKYRIAFSCILLLIFCASVSSLVYTKYTKYQEQKAFEELEEKKKQVLEEQSKQEEQRKLQEQKKLEEQKKWEQENQKIEEEPEEEEEIVEELVILPEYQELYEENSDLYGWIKIDDTVIDYPVMHTPETPNYYNHRNWEKEDSKSGTLHVDARTILDETENTIIYGHHMKNGTMFGSLKKYKDISYYDSHKYIEFNTIYEKAKYEIVSVSKAVVYYEDGTEIVSDSPEGAFEFYNYVELDTYEKFYEYIDKAKANEYYPTGVTAKYGDKLITLCTCDYWTTNARLLVIAKKIE